ncbi:MFS transporter [Dyella nitratireducens]|uniref:MFS transporter n=1 Tax=Dyella nitratireducens TaxID=1849580 RepID=A0ABQ1FPC8_9GAMM|nr:MFS transporter [Dyella nitratireducens]GGA23634.1 MFS transporter [Dyella nitratireducens]GLQ43942.1 MFS transporter [Dyella nitratireducens]
MNTQNVAGDPRRWLALPVLLAGAFLPPLDFFIVNVALPSIRAALHASAAQLQFVISAYAATYAVFLITGGRLGDLYGRRRMFLLGIAGFTLASLLCGLAWSSEALLAGRVLQGMTAAALAPQVLASIRVMFPHDEQPRALGLYSATFGVAATLGALLGGGLVSSHLWGMGWQLIFLVNLPLGVAALIAGFVLLRESRAEHALRLDLGGVALLSIALALLVYPLVEGREQGWPAWTYVMLIGSLAMFIVFVRFEAHVAKHGGSPLIDVRLFGEGDFSIGILAALGIYLTSSFFLTYAVYLQSGLQHSALQAGLATVPFTIGFFCGSMLASRLIDALGHRALPLACVCEALGFGVLIATVLHALPHGALVPGLAVAGFGFGVALPALIRTVISSVETKHAGLASGMVITALQISAALGVAIIGGVFYTVLHGQISAKAYDHAFATGLCCNAGALLLVTLLSMSMGRAKQNNAQTRVVVTMD